MPIEGNVKFADLVDAKLRADLVTIDTPDGVPVFNTKFEIGPAGEIKIPVTGKATVKTYDKVNGGSPDGVSQTYETINNLNDVYIMEVIDGYDMESINNDIVADRLMEQATAGAEELDEKGIATIEAGSTISDDNDLSTAQTIFDKFIEAQIALDEAKVPQKGRYALVSPRTHALLIKDKDNFIKRGDISQELVMQGYVGEVAGFVVKKTTFLDPNTEFVCGHSNWATRYRAWSQEPDVDSPGKGKYVGAVIVDARWVYQHKITKSEAFYLKNNLPTDLVLDVTESAGQVIVNDIFGDGVSGVTNIAYAVNYSATKKIPSDGEAIADYSDFTKAALPATITGLSIGDEVSVVALDGSDNVLGIAYHTQAQ